MAFMNGIFENFIVCFFIILRTFYHTKNVLSMRSRESSSGHDKVCVLVSFSLVTRIAAQRWDILFFRSNNAVRFAMWSECDVDIG